MTLRRQLEPFASTGRRAYCLTARLFDAIIIVLRRDKRFAGINSYELDAVLADVRNETERHLFDELRDRVHLDDVDVVDGNYP